MAARGIGGFFIHPMPMPSQARLHRGNQPYPGEMFFEWVKEAAEAARTPPAGSTRGGWPSGTLVGRLADGRPELAGRVQRAVPEAGTPRRARAWDGEEVDAAGTGGRRLRFYASREGYPTDLMNPATTDAFLAATHDAYARAWRRIWGLVPGVFTDEAAVGGVMGTDRVP